LRVLGRGLKTEKLKFYDVLSYAGSHWQPRLLANNCISREVRIRKGILENFALSKVNKYSSKSYSTKIAGHLS
jgi:hypothetical protein